MDNKKIKEFPDVENKLQAPTKQSIFAQQKKEAEAKRLREEAETAAVYEDFVKSFDDEDGSSTGFGGSRVPPGFGGVSGPPRRHFGGGSGIPTGPGGRGGLGPGRGGGLTSGPGSLGPPPSSLSRKRAFEGPHHAPRRNDERGLLAFDDHDADHHSPARAFNTSDDEDQRQGSRSAEPAVPKPTLRLSNLPPGTSPAVIKALLPKNLTIDAVRIIPPAGPNAGIERKSMSAIVTLAKETPGNDVDAAVNTLQNRYLGYGFYLSLHRHLSSAALASVPTLGTTSGATSQPFGAKQVNVDTGNHHSHGPSGHHRGGFAPPTSYAPTGPGQLGRTGPLLHVPVQPPSDIKELKLIHKTIEALLTHGPEFEALLMSRPEVRREEKWAWLWDARSTGGVWYRWRLWDILTGSQTRRGQGTYLPLFEDSSAWKAPDHSLAFEYITRLDEFVSDSEYNSSDDDESADEGAPRRPQHRGGGPPPDTSNLTNEDDKRYLNPLEKAKLTHLLARLPTSTGKLRKGDVARVTAFAISHAGRGADEVVSAIISNIEKPFAYTSANPDRKRDKEASKDDAAPATANDEEEEDMSSAKLIGVYIISDILSSSSTSGVRHAWRYRQLFEAALKQRQLFENLGRLEKRMSWGRLRAEKWKRSVGNVLSLWEGWCVFPQDSQDWFVRMFNEPPATKEEEVAEKERQQEAKAKSKWKSVEVAAVKNEHTSPAPIPVSASIVDDDVDGMPMDDDEDVDGVPMDEDDEDVDGVPLDGADGDPMQEDDEYEPPPPDPPSPPRYPPRDVAEPSVSAQAPPEPGPARPARSRPRAVDMFADSGSEGEGE
ncbi:MAG: hypothetical protein M1818_005188 [Claussenomyces sp. TS43310]|nr:MAG: hypothetical protein M1818_005188 [Claussenomyces sp. TS43310]